MSGYIFKPLKIRAFICIKNHQLEDLMEDIMFTTTTKNLNCLGIKKNVQGLHEEKKKKKLLQLSAVPKRKWNKWKVKAYSWIGSLKVIRVLTGLGEQGKLKKLITKTV